jgi:hypothetical protein
MTEPDPSWAQYPCTVLEIHRAEAGAAMMEVDLRVPISDSTARELRELGLGPRWAVITAYNPHGQNRDPGGNAARHAKLEAALRESGKAFLRADGRSPDASHREIGLAVGLPQPDAAALAARFGQSAIFWFDGEAFWLVSAAAAAEPIRLPPVAEGA